MNRLRGWRTLAFNAVVALAWAAVPVIEPVVSAMPDEWQRWALLIVVVGNVILRLDTRTPVGRRQDPGQ